jgi:hypothetical protein
MEIPEIRVDQQDYENQNEMKTQLAAKKKKKKKKKKVNDNNDEAL